MVPDAAIVRPGDGAQLGPAALGLERLDHLGTMRQQAVLEIDAGERRRQLAQIAGRRADEAAQLAEAPVRGRNWGLAAGDDQLQPLGVVAPRLDADRAALQGPRRSAIRPRPHRGIEVRQRQKALVIGPGKPLGRNAPHALAAR